MHEFALIYSSLCGTQLTSGWLHFTSFELPSANSFHFNVPSQASTRWALGLGLNTFGTHLPAHVGWLSLVAHQKYGPGEA